MRSIGPLCRLGGRAIPELDHPIIARAAFRAAVEQYPKARIRLRNRALVMEEHKPKTSAGLSFD
jgi:hypothetical protein